MAIFHYTIKIVGRSKGKSVISASAYLNGDVMKNEETGRISYYTSKKEVVYTSLMMCENAPPEWQIVPEENIKRFQKSVRYKRSEDKEAALKKFKITFQKQRLWNEVLKIEKNADAQLGRSFEFALPKEWSRQEQIQYTTDYIQKTFVDRGMCADWSIHDKGRQFHHGRHSSCSRRCDRRVPSYVPAHGGKDEAVLRALPDRCRTCRGRRRHSAVAQGRIAERRSAHGGTLPMLGIRFRHEAKFRTRALDS